MAKIAVTCGSNSGALFDTRSIFLSKIAAMLGTKNGSAKRHHFSFLRNVSQNTTVTSKSNIKKPEVAHSR